MAIKREFKNGETAHLCKGKRMKGYTLKSDTPVTIIKACKIEEKAGAYLYDIEVVNPKTNEKEVYPEWVTQFDLYPKKMWEKHVEQENVLNALQAKFDTAHMKKQPL